MSYPAPETETLLASLPTLQRLALAYAPARARLPVLALFALDARLASVLRHSREPMMAQLRLAWWRESLGQPAGAWPEGEPLLALLRCWDGQHGTLTPLVDGWEALTGPAPLEAEALTAMAQGRGQAFAALAEVVGEASDSPAAASLGKHWALADLAQRLGHPLEKETARTLAEAQVPPRSALSRAMRPLQVLHGLTYGKLRKGTPAGATSPAEVLLALRLGLLGR